MTNILAALHACDDAERSLRTAAERAGDRMVSDYSLAWRLELALGSVRRFRKRLAGEPETAKKRLAVLDGIELGEAGA